MLKGTWDTGRPVLIAAPGLMSHYSVSQRQNVESSIIRKVMANVNNVQTTVI